MDRCAQDYCTLAKVCCYLSREVKPKKPRPLPGSMDWVGDGMLILGEVIVSRRNRSGQGIISQSGGASAEPYVGFPLTCTCVFGGVRGMMIAWPFEVGQQMIWPIGVELDLARTLVSALCLLRPKLARPMLLQLSLSHSSAATSIAPVGAIAIKRRCCYFLEQFARIV